LLVGNRAIKTIISDTGEYRYIDGPQIGVQNGIGYGASETLGQESESGSGNMILLKE
jgi:hypothetical protein